MSFDGTWSKRGFTANYEVEIVISADTGEVLNYVVFSKVCELCKAAEKLKSNPMKYQEWKNALAATGLSQKNFDSSSPAMEKEASRILCSRSVICNVMLIAKLKLRCEIHIGFVKIVRSMKIWIIIRVSKVV